VWQKAIDLAALVYTLSGTFPLAEQRRQGDQICRAVTSISLNIAEGNGRASAKEYAHFLSIAKGSLLETETCLVLATRLGFTTEAETDPILALIEELSKMLTRLRSRVVDLRRQGVIN
jgi:four helix bundle protein